MKVFHGTTLEIREPDTMHSREYLDFGIGFYTTSFMNPPDDIHLHFWR